MPTIVGKLGGLEHFSWVVTAYLLTSTASTPLYGKISDLYGRRPVLLFAIGTFLVGSLLAGLSQEMWQLIATRAIQGLGAGGLMTLAFTIISDLVSPRERAKYQGLFGAVFGLSSIAGPLLGGYFADNNWRWIFYINLPLGLIALVTISTVLKIPHVRRDHKVDYLGAALLVSGVSTLLLMLSWGGTEYAWSSNTIIGLGVAGTVLSVLFVLWELRASEPIIPMTLFRSRNFTLSNIGGFVLGVAMFGAILYVPMYLQIVKGYSATASGLLLTPLMAGVILTSIVSGRVISRIGRYKWLTVAGTVVLTIGMFTFVLLERNTSMLQMSTSMVTIGIGMGLVMQPLVLAVQNGLSSQHMGAGTAAVTFFRSLGGAFGVALLGAVLNNRLQHWLAELMPQRPGGPAAGGGDFTDLLREPAKILAMPDLMKIPLQESFVRSLHTVFWVAAVISIVAIVVTVLMPDGKLSGPESHAAPRDPEAAASEAEAAAVV
jgi:EmrB/QacA subfamily drug resistance transporter